MGKLFFVFLICLLNSSFGYTKDNQVIKPLTQVSVSVELPRKFELLVWNIYKGAKVGWEADLKKLSYGKQIVLLQEATDSTDFINGLKRVDFESTLAISWVSQDRIATGVATLATAQALSMSWQKSYYLEPITNTPKISFFTEYRIEGSSKSLLVVNIHAINFVRAYKFIHMINKALVKMRTHDGPIVFAGDFNTWTRSKVNMLNSALKKDGFIEVSFTPDQRKKVFGKHLDYIWYKGLKLLNSKAYGDIKSSDHKPMSARFILK